MLYRSIMSTTRVDRKKFGCLPGITDRDYYTNSNHVPVYYKCSARHKAELLAVYTCELARQPFGRRGQYAVIMLVLVGELVGTVAHVSHDSESQFLSLFRFSVMLAQKRHKTFRQTDEPDAQRTLIDYGP